MINSLLDASELAAPDQLVDGSDNGSLETLFGQGQYEAVSRASAQRLQELNADSADVLEEAAQTWVWRMRALLSLGLGAQVAEETKRNLSNLPQTNFLDEKNLPLWDLAILVLPVFQNGFNEGAIKELYRYAHIARQAVQHASTEQLKHQWQQNLHSLQLYIVGVLLGLKDYDTAVDLLRHGLTHAEDDAQSEQLALVLSLVFIQFGDSASAKDLATRLNPKSQEIVLALSQFVESRSVPNSETDDFQIRLLDSLGRLLVGDFAKAEHLIESAKDTERKDFAQALSFLNLLLFKAE